ncbi:LytR family transcriptional attenuator [Antricoccus suffuscus]|uniref:LytR family transcriptional attenuator n=1 Tax=Antricoccus suffuscus TaxID=1629062 RepID=A0A2T1A0C2_9ACTN|nr:LCP family protein [Antricoccus suffuscus]PRZ42050.1 LytR family transcriptional attenuator [Antricoccus suffuscus]
MTTGTPLLRRRGVIIALSVVAVLLLAVAVDLIVLSSRIREVTVAFPKATDSIDTWIVVGSDSRADLPAGASSEQFGTTGDVPGARADIILMVSRYDDGTTRVVSIPRDLVLIVDKAPVRATLAMQKGPQGLIDGLCTTLRIPADHFVQIDFGGFVAVVDDLGGIDVNLPHPIRDPITGLDVPKAGEVHLDGQTALALVRSRTAEELINGAWVPTSDGPDQRAKWGGVVMSKVVAKATSKAKNPLVLQGLLWTLTGALTTDSGTGLFDLTRLSSASGNPTELPHQKSTYAGTDIASRAVQPDGSTYAALKDAGYAEKCTPAG